MLTRPPWLGAIQLALCLAFYAGVLVGVVLGSVR